MRRGAVRRTPSGEGGSNPVPFGGEWSPPTLHPAVTRRYSHLVHLHVLLVQGQLEVGVVGGRPELVARQHEEDEGGGLHQELEETQGRGRGIAGLRLRSQEICTNYIKE